MAKLIAVFRCCTNAYKSLVSGNISARNRVSVQDCQHLKRKYEDALCIKTKSGGNKK